MRYPIYVISKGRAGKCLTANFLIADGLPFNLVIEPQEEAQYREKYPDQNIIVLPFSNLGMGGTPARNFCWEHSIKEGHKRHWILDDNIDGCGRFFKGKRIKCSSDVAFSVVEDFTERYENVAISGMNYKYFIPYMLVHPFYFNCHVYSCMLILNSIPQRWRLKYNEDTDLCLQVLSTNHWCTILVNTFFCYKTATMTMKGGNTDELYKDNGRLRMARSLEKMWPEFVRTKWRFNRPQHVVNWKQHFKVPLIRIKDIDWDKLKNSNEYGLKLNALKPPKSKTLQKMLLEENKKNNQQT